MTCIPSSSCYPPPFLNVGSTGGGGLCTRVCAQEVRKRPSPSPFPTPSFSLLLWFFFSLSQPPQAFCQKSKWSVSNERFLFDPYTRTISPHSHVLFIFYRRLQFWYQLFFSSYLNNDEYRSYPSTYPSTYPNFFVRDKKKGKSSKRKVEYVGPLLFFSCSSSISDADPFPPCWQGALSCSCKSCEPFFFFSFLFFHFFLTYPPLCLIEMCLIDSDTYRE